MNRRNFLTAIIAMPVVIAVEPTCESILGSNLYNQPKSKLPKSQTNVGRGMVSSVYTIDDIPHGHDYINLYRSKIKGTV